MLHQLSCSFACHRMINSGRFIGLEWLDKEKTVFKVPWIHAKKRGYCRERDAALFREWAIHSGKYRQDSDPTVWKINFRCAINGLKDIQEIKDMQTEDCRVYKVYPSRSRRRRRAIRRTAADPYPNCSTAYTDSKYGSNIVLCAMMFTLCFSPLLVSSQHIYSAYPGMAPYHGMGCGVTSAPTTDSLYGSAYPPSVVKHEYPTAGHMHSQYSLLPNSVPASMSGVYSHLPQTTTTPSSIAPTKVRRISKIL